MATKNSILVTGGGGYIGSVLVSILLKLGHKVTVVDNFRYGQTPLLDVCNNSNLEIKRGDVGNENLMRSLVIGADVIFPLACLTGAPICDRYPAEAKAVNLDAIKYLLKIRSKNQIIIFPNTNSGYGIGQATIYCTEKTPLKPISLYGKLKVEAEKRILDSGNSISLRLATVFGISPRMRIDLLVNDFVWRAVKDRYVVLYEAHFRRNYIHVRDVCEAFIFSLNNFKKMKNEIYNVGLSNANLSKFDLCQEIKKQIADFYFVETEVGSDPDKRDYIVSNEKIEKRGFLPKVSLSVGIAELIKGYQILDNPYLTNA